MASARELEALLSRAMSAHQAGRLAEAQNFYKSLLKEAPGHAPTLHFLGLSYFQEGHPDKGVEFVARALALKPDYVEAHYNLATALQGLGRFEEAADHYEQALVLDPNNPDALNNLGAILLELKRGEEAIAHFEKALAINPNSAQAHSNLGTVLKGLRRHDDAIGHFERARAIDPANPEVDCNLGAALQETGRFHDSLAAYDSAATLAPGFADAQLGRGNALASLGRFDDALAAFDRALGLKPDLAEAWLGRGHAGRELKRHDEAASDYGRALTHKPNLEYAQGYRLYAKMNDCDWSDFEAARAHIVADLESGSAATTPWLLLSVSPSAAAQQLCAQLYARQRYPGSTNPLWSGERYSHDRIRIAYVSEDLRNHAVARLIAELFERHDRARFETFAFSLGADDGSAMRARLVPAFDHFIDVSAKSDGEIASLIRENEIDIAVDLMGFTGNARAGVFAMRPAPLQINYLGYPGTMGADYIDYIMADHVIIPAEQQNFYSEKIAYLPHSYQPTDTTRKISAPPSRFEAGLPENGFVFCSFNNSFKITPEIFDVWMRLLGGVDSSVLWLLDGERLSGNLRREAEKRGIAAERLIFAQRVSPEAHLARHRLADLFLDTAPYNAHTTASDALWAGLPVLTHVGSTFAGRVAASILTAAGLPELIAGSLAEYEATALKLAGKPDLLASLKSKLADNRLTQPLFDTGLMARHVEAAYVTMWERHQRGEPAATFSV